MPYDAPPEPWRSLLHELDAAGTGPVDLVCIGGFVLTAVYDAPRTTADLDVLPAVNDLHAEAILQLARRDGDLHRRFGVYIDPVTVATPPEDFEARLGEVFSGAFRRIRLLAPDAYDLSLLKLERNSQRDREDVKWLAQSAKLDPAELRRRYRSELRPNLIGPVQQHDLTMELWVEMLVEDRSWRS